MTTDPPPLLGNRSLLEASVHIDDNGRLWLRLFCDCAHGVDADVTDVTGDFAITCDGCNTVRWFAAIPTDMAAAEDADDAR